MSLPEALPPRELHPSQPLIDAERLRSVVRWVDFGSPEPGPLPVVRFGGPPILTDGHTRALAAYLAGAETVAIREDPDLPDYDTELYRECVMWCRAEGVTAVPDLAGRVEPRETFRDRWVRRCHASPHGSGTDAPTSGSPGAG